MVLGTLPQLRRSAGGVYQYSLSVLRALRDWSGEVAHEFVLLADPVEPSLMQELRAAGWRIERSSSSPAKAVLKKWATTTAVGGAALSLLEGLQASLPDRRIDVDSVRSRPRDRRWLERLRIDLMLYTTPNRLSFEAGVPFIMSVPDLQHRLQPEFPEVSANGEWERREYVFRNAARHATTLLAESEFGKEDILRFYGPYGITPERVKVLPLLPAAYLPVEVSAAERARVRRTYALPGRYLFYPAQFWPHKNHVRVIQALARLAADGVDAHLVLCGTWDGEIRRRTFEEVQRVARETGVAARLVTLGYVPDPDMGPLYANAAGLVMPTFFGPSNIPILEAWAFGCPVITSDIRGVAEQAGDAALLVDPRSVEAIAAAMGQLWSDEAIARTLVENGRRRLGLYTPADFKARLVRIIEEASPR